MNIRRVGPQRKVGPKPVDADDQDTLNLRHRPGGLSADQNWNTKQGEGREKMGACHSGTCTTARPLSQPMPVKSVLMTIRRNAIRHPLNLDPPRLLPLAGNPHIDAPSRQQRLHAPRPFQHDHPAFA